MKDIEDRVLAYERSLRLGNAKLSPKQTIQEQVANFRASLMQAQPIIEQVRQLLDRFGVPLILYPSYVSYALQLNKLCGAFSSETLLREVRLHTGVWAGRGLSPEVLNSIRAEVLGLPDLPGPEGPLPE